MYYVSCFFGHSLSLWLNDCCLLFYVIYILFWMNPFRVYLLYIISMNQFCHPFIKWIKFPFYSGSLNLGNVLCISTLLFNALPLLFCVHKFSFNLFHIIYSITVLSVSIQPTSVVDLICTDYLGAFLSASLWAASIFD